MAVQDGTLTAITIGGTQISNLTTNSFSLTMGTRNTTTKDSGAAEEMAPTRYTGTVSGSALFEEAAPYGFTDMFAAFIAGTTLAVKYTTGASGDKEYTIGGFFTDVSRDDPDADNSEVSFTIQISGTVSEGTIA